jgi:hypothetical protein
MFAGLYPPSYLCNRRETDASRRRAPGNARRRRLSRSSQNRTPPCQRTPTQRIPPSNPCVILHHEGLFGVYMRSSALAYFRQHGASDYHQTVTRVSTSRTFYQQIPTVVYGRSGVTTRPLSHNGHVGVSGTTGDLGTAMAWLTGQWHSCRAPLFRRLA